MQLTANEHEYDWENLLVVRVGGNVAEAHGDETGEAKVEASAVPTLVGWVMWAFHPKIIFVEFYPTLVVMWAFPQLSLGHSCLYFVIYNWNRESGLISNSQTLKLFEK